jgi:hypothetical protein
LAPLLDETCQQNAHANGQSDGEMDGNESDDFHDNDHQKEPEKLGKLNLLRDRQMLVAPREPTAPAEGSSLHLLTADRLDLHVTPPH